MTSNVRPACVVVLILTAISAFIFAARTYGQTALPEFAISGCSAPPVLDGKLDDACWQAAGRVNRFHIMGTDRTDEQKAMLSYDDTWLYIGFEIRHPNPKMIRPLVLQHDGSVSSDDSVEIFLDPGDGTPLYFHFQLNAANVRAEQRVRKAGSVRERDWNLPWRSATAVTSTGWNAEIAVPLTALASYGDLEAFRMNLCIAVVEPTIDPHGIVVGHRTQHLSWSPVIRSFHEPDRFGKISGLKPVRIRTPFLPAFRDVRVGKYDLSQGTYSYPVTLFVWNDSGTAGAADLVVSDRPLSGQTSEVKERIEMQGGERRSVTVSVPVATLSGRQVVVALRDPATGEVLRSEAAADTDALTLMETYLDRNYYTSEKEAVAVCAPGLPEADVKNVSLSVRDESGTVLGRVRQGARETRIPFRISSLKTGSHALTVSVHGEKGRELFTKNLVLVKKTPNPVLEVKIDRINRAVLKNGKPVLPFGVVLPSCREEDFAVVAQTGFNSFIHWWSDTKPSVLRDILALSKKYNLDMIPALDYLLPEDTSKGGRVFLKYLEPDPKLPEAERMKKYEELYQNKMNAVREGVLRAKEDPNVLAYISIDEPEDNHWLQRACRDYYDLAHAVDGYRPVHLNTGAYNFDVWRDILGGDPYWSPATANPLRNDPVSALRYCYGYPYRDYIRTSEKLRIPLWMIPCAETWSGVNKRAFLPEEQVSQTWLLMIHGIRGFFYFVYPFSHEATYDVFRRLSGEIRALTPCLLAPDVAQRVTYTPGEMDPWNGKFPDVHVNLRANPDGGCILLAANSRYYPVDTRFRVSSLRKSGEVRQMFSKNILSVENGSFGEQIESLGVRAYLLPGPREPRGAAVVEVDAKARPELAVPEAPEIPRSGRTGKKNLVQNPGFEQATFPGWPDYYRIYAYNLVGPSIGTDRVWYMDPTAPFEGRHSLRMKVNEHRISSFRMGFMFYLTPQVDRPTPCTFSLYMKAKGKGMKVQMFAPNMEGAFYARPAVPLSENWQRYSLTTVIQPRQDLYGVYGLAVYGDGTVWADALQVEKGEVPTEYEP